MGCACLWEVVLASTGDAMNRPFWEGAREGFIYGHVLMALVFIEWWVSR